jgi:hypothetical protein
MPLYRSGFSCTPETWARLIGSSPARWRCQQRRSVVAPPTRLSTRVLLITGFDKHRAGDRYGGRGDGEVGPSGTGDAGLTSS